MRYYGPMIAFGFYMTQILHAILFYTVFGPALCNQFVNYPNLALFINALGWILCFKVTYLYYRVSTTSPGVPSKDLCQAPSTLDGQKACGEKLNIDVAVAKRYSTDMAEILRYSQIASADFETFENALS